MWGPRSDPPTPQAAYLTRAGTVLRVEFGQPLRHRFQHASNWTGNAWSRALRVLNAWVDGSSLVAACRLGDFTGLPNRISYTPPPFDIHNLYGQPAAAFLAYPLQVFP